ncbi:MAG: HNH endonuclease [Hormoscilla sp. GM7CHS1pb]|nr:HNH endonuclease [Hormoscilla sp. GM7CHS1pb]
MKLNRFLPNCGIFYQGVIVSERRKFSKREWQILFYGAFGRCAMCGQPLGRDFHADHRIPYSKGGKTSLDNGAANALHFWMGHFARNDNSIELYFRHIPQFQTSLL